MNNLSYNNNSRIIASTIDIPATGNDFGDFLKKIKGLPLIEIEIEADHIASIQDQGLIGDTRITVVLNYPLGGCQPDYILDSIRWARKQKIDIVCCGLPYFWMRSNEISNIADFITDLKKACGEKILRLAIESDELTLDEIFKICDLIEDAGIHHLQTSCGFAHNTNIETILNIQKKHHNLLLTIDNNLPGDSLEIDSLFKAGVDYVCIKEPWLYHF